MQTYGLIFDTCVGIILQYCCLCFWVIDSLQLVLCRMAAVKRLPVHHHCANYIFWLFGIIWFILSHFENKSLLEPVLGSVTNVAYFSTCHEQTQLNRVCYFFVTLVNSLLPKDLTIQNLFIFTAAGVMPCGGRTTPPRTSP